MATTDLKGAAGAGVPTAKIKKLSDNYFKRMQIMREDGKFEALDPKKDSKSIWFSKEAIDKLFTDNGYTGDSTGFGLRIYFGMHDKKNILTDIPDHAHNKLMTVLVATKAPSAEATHVDMLTSTQAKMTAEASGEVTAGGDGLNHGKICPPESCV
ncbi:hypothetical protein [Mucilaginibacter gilvus]|uniref:Uncharacterized protein n=1 Tax=Mucilaginibacter gilvus TaxID=2305909 RepID=A0A444MNP3_9SPHI|nr:hypothetical protein [Mucilaginibacter gilvus]RWY52258.1 hypothetical protein EPL05_10080 [Mucilaginibacter gilvus]